MIPEKIIEIIKNLIKKTEAGLIDWKACVRESEFNADFKTGRFCVDKELKPVESSHKLLCYYSFLILDKDGKEIVRTSRSKLSATEQDEYLLLRKLYDTVFKLAINYDEKLDDLLKEINKLK